MIICLVGKSGSGKSTVANLLCSYSDSIFHIDIDSISHRIINDEEVSKRLVENFGDSIIKDGQIDRKELGRIVFSSRDCMSLLESITWPVMEKEIDSLIRNHPDNTILLDWQLLPKTKYFKTCDMRILVTAPFKERMKRAILRDHITEEKFQERESASLELKEQDFDYVILNIDRENTNREVFQIYEKSIIHR